MDRQNVTAPAPSVFSLLSVYLARCLQIQFVDESAAIYFHLNLSGLGIQDADEDNIPARSPSAHPDRDSWYPSYLSRPCIGGFGRPIMTYLNVWHG